MLSNKQWGILANTFRGYDEVLVDGDTGEVVKTIATRWGVFGEYGFSRSVPTIMEASCTPADVGVA
jgi:hypothetical protein